jgi:hypothetical protein
MGLLQALGDNRKASLEIDKTNLTKVELLRSVQE